MEENKPPMSLENAVEKQDEQTFTWEYLVLWLEAEVPPQAHVFEHLAPVVELFWEVVVPLGWRA